MTNFVVHGPLEVPRHRGKGGWTIIQDNVAQFWEDNPSLRFGRGCYVFGIQAGKGFTPGYVGQAKATFKQEVFSSDKIMKYQQFLANYKKGTPVLFFVAAPKKRGAPNVNHIKDLEDYLITIGVTANPSLLNIKGTKTEEWGILGVLRGGRGKPTNAATDFRRMMKLP